MTLKREDTLTIKAVAAMRAAVKNVINDHRQQGRPIVVWRDGKVVREMPATTQAVRESGATFGAEAGNDAQEAGA